jgi:hypothetical protein
LVKEMMNEEDIWWIKKEPKKREREDGGGERAKESAEVEGVNINASGHEQDASAPDDQSQESSVGHASN